MSVAERRLAAIAETVARVRELERARGVTREGVGAIQAELLKLAAQTELFPGTSFPAPDGDARARARLYRLWREPDDRFALYANASAPGVESPPHNHTTWAVVVGMRGEELNCFYHRSADGVELVRQVPVTGGTGVAMLPDDVHSIHIRGAEPVLNFHMYGLALERLDAREYFDARTGTWKRFPPLREIHEPLD